MLSDSSEPKPAEGLWSFARRGPAVPWSPVAGLLFTLVLFVGSQAVVFLLLSVLFANVTLGVIADQFAFVALSEACIMAVLWLLLRRRKQGWRLLGFMRRPEWRDVWWAVLSYVAYFGLLLVVMNIAQLLTPINLDQKQELGFEGLSGAGELAMAAISLVVLPPIVEEIVFRGFLYSGLRAKLRFGWAAAITSLFFGALHLMGANDGLLWIAGIDTFVLSMVLCYLREKTGALWAPMLVHAAKNLLAFLLLVGVISSGS